MAKETAARIFATPLSNHAPGSLDTAVTGSATTPVQDIQEPTSAVTPSSDISKKETKPFSTLSSPINPNVENSPTDQAGIIDHIRRVSTSLPVEDVPAVGTPPATLSPKGSNASAQQKSAANASENAKALSPVTAHVEQFPTKQNDIIEHIRRVSISMPEEEVIAAGTPPSPVAARRGSDTASSLARTVSNTSDVSGSPLDPINEGEEESPKDSSEHKPDPKEVLLDSVMAAAILKHGPDSSAKKQTKDDEQEHDRKHHHHRAHQFERERSGPAEPLTPPMTPIVNELEVSDGGRFDSFESSMGNPESDSTRKRSDNTTDNITAKNSIASTPTEAMISSEKQDGFIAMFRGFFYGFSSWFTSLCGGSGRAT